MHPNHLQRRVVTGDSWPELKSPKIAIESIKSHHFTDQRLPKTGQKL